MAVNEISVQELITALGDENDDVRRRAQIALHDLGVLAIEPLGQALLHTQPEVRRRVAAILGHVGDARAVEPLIAALKALGPRDDLTRVQITDALGHFGDPRAAAALLDELPQASSAVRRRIIRALVSLGDDRAIPALRALEDDPAVGETARWALNHLGA